MLIIGVETRLQSKYIGRTKYVYKKCEHCRLLSWIQPRLRFCSNECSQAHRALSAKFVYTDGNRNPKEWITCPVCSTKVLVYKGGKYCSRECFGLDKRGENHWKYGKGQFKGTRAEYMYLHQVVRIKRGKADHCINGCEATRFHWANMTGNYEDVNDYQQMCPKCHAEFDRERELH